MLWQTEVSHKHFIIIIIIIIIIDDDDDDDDAFAMKLSKLFQRVRYRQE